MDNDGSQTTSSSNAEIASLKAHISYLETKIAELEAKQNGTQSHSARSEARLFAEVGALARRPPFSRTTRRDHVLDKIEFPEECAYDPSVSLPITYVTDEMKDKTFSWSFASVNMEPQELMLHWFIMFSEAQLFQKLNLAPETLREFFRLVHNSYRGNVYHNFQHAMDVAQFAFAVYMHSDTLKSKFDEIDLFSCLVLGLAHDMDHPGVNNAFLIKTRDPIATLYNDKSVLEQAHAATLFYMLTTHPNGNILGGLDEEQFTRARKSILRGILATDMGRHFAIIKDIEALEPIGTSTEMTEDIKLTMVDAVAKCGDICHLVRPWPVAKAWEDLVMMEFFEQGDQEKAAGMKPDGLFDREQCKIPNSQCWFYENMGKPLFEALARHLPDTQHLVDTMMKENLPNWKAMC